MLNTYMKFILLFLFSVFAQVLIFDKIYIIGYVNIFIYILFLLSLPVDLNKFMVLGLAFILGLSVDMFNSTPGLNAAATVLIGYLRPVVLGMYSPRDGYETNKLPGIKTYGWYWFIRYSLTLILIHHTFLYFLEVFSFADFFNTIVKIILSSVSTLVFVILSHLLFSEK